MLYEIDKILNGIEMKPIMEIDDEMPDHVKEEIYNTPKYIQDCPVFCHWVTYNGKVKFAILNYEESLKRGKAMIDIGYCATALMINNRVEKTVPYSKRFKIQAEK